jgi:hypothetical protein
MKLLELEADYANNIEAYWKEHARLSSAMQAHHNHVMTDPISYEMGRLLAESMARVSAHHKLIADQIQANTVSVS